MSFAERRQLAELRERIADHLEDIAAMFNQRPKITIVIRTPWLEEQGKDGGVVLTDDDFDAAIAEINKLRGRLDSSRFFADDEAEELLAKPHQVKP